jgi:prepilin peptidase CpaA
MVFGLLGTAIVLTGVAAAWDWRKGEIPNWLTLPVIPVACAFYAWQGGWVMLGWTLAAAALCALVPVFLFYKGAMGGGDVKLFIAIGALLGLNLGIETQFVALIFASIGALVRLAWQGKLFQTFKTSALLVTNAFRRKAQRVPPSSDMLTEVRLGPAIFAATVCVVLTELWNGGYF